MQYLSEKLDLDCSLSTTYQIKVENTKEPDIPICRNMEVLQKKFCTNGHLFKTQKLEVRHRLCVQLRGPNVAYLAQLVEKPGYEKRQKSKMKTIVLQVWDYQTGHIFVVVQNYLLERFSWSVSSECQECYSLCTVKSSNIPQRSFITNALNKLP